MEGILFFQREKHCLDPAIGRATELGEIVTDRLVEHFGNLIAELGPLLGARRSRPSDG